MQDTHLILSVGFCYSLMLGFGFLSARRARRNASGDSWTDMFLAGRKIPLWIGVMTMTATWVGGGSINGTAESIYSRGLVWSQAPWAYALSLLLGGLLFAKTMRTRNFATLLDPFQQKYGKEATALFFLPALIGELFWSGAILTALGSTFATILNIDYSLAIVGCCCVAMAYTIFGGLWTLAYTDVIQLTFIVLGIGLALPFAVEHAGGLTAVLAHYKEHFADKAQLYPDLVWGPKIWYWLDTSLLLVLGGIPWGVYFQRVLACPNERAAQRLSYLAGFGCLLLAVPPALAGALATKFNWQELIGKTPEPAMILPYVVKYLTPHWVGVCCLGAIGAAIMSSVNASFLSLGSLFTWNVYRPWRAKEDPRHLLLVSRVAILFAACLAAALALSVKSVYALWFLCSDLVYVLLFPQLLLVLYFPRINKVGALVGFAVGLFLRLGAGEVSLGLPPFLPYPWADENAGVLFPMRTFSMLCSLLTVFFVSLLLEKHSTFSKKYRNR